MNASLAVAFDASLLDEPTTGIGLYARCLSRAVQAEGVRVIQIGARHSGELPRGAMGRTAFALAGVPRVLQGLDAPLFHAVSNFNLPLAKVPGKRMVLTVHDLIPLLLPDTVSAAFRWQFRLWLFRSLRVADRILCVSERTREDLLAHFELSPERVQVVPLGVDHVDHIPSPDRASLAYLESLRLPERFVLYAGSLDVRKNVELVLDAAASLRESGAPISLVLVGQSWFGANAAERRITSLRSAGLDIRVLGYQPASIFYEVMRRSTAFVFPSRYEGFGLPPLEAMRLGVPVIVSNAGALPEVCGQAAISVSPTDREGLAKAIHGLLTNPDERRERAEAGRRWAAGFTWQRAARETLALYRAALEA